MICSVPCANYQCHRLCEKLWNDKVSSVAGHGQDRKDVQLKMESSHHNTDFPSNRGSGQLMSNVSVTLSMDMIAEATGFSINVQQDFGNSLFFVTIL